MQEDFPFPLRKAFHEVVSRRSAIVEELQAERTKKISNSAHMESRDFTDRELAKIAKDFDLQTVVRTLPHFNYTYLELRSRRFAFIQKQFHKNAPIRHKTLLNRYSVPYSELFGFFSEPPEPFPLILCYGKQDEKEFYSEFSVRTVDRNWIEALTLPLLNSSGFTGIVAPAHQSHIVPEIKIALRTTKESG